MRVREITLVLFFLVNSIFAIGQCEYTLLNYTHNDCYSDNMKDLLKFQFLILTL